jgi:hypothetical protein
MDKLFELCPSLVNMHSTDRLEALVRMCIAHVLNGHEYVGIYETAEAYLEGLTPKLRKER